MFITLAALAASALLSAQASNAPTLTCMFNDGPPVPCQMDLVPDGNNLIFTFVTSGGVVMYGGQAVSDSKLSVVAIAINEAASPAEGSCLILSRKVVCTATVGDETFKTEASL